jgi:FeS assembly SUF system protein
MSVDEEDLPVYQAHAGKDLKDGASIADMNSIIDAIKTVFDPEIPINVYDLGLIYNINQQNNGDLFIEMTLTAPGCPVAGILPQQVADAAASVDGVGKVQTTVVWEPAWTIDLLSEDAKIMMEMM